MNWKRTISIVMFSLLLQVSCAQNPTNIELEISAIEIISSKGSTGRALIVYQPGYSILQGVSPMP